jgi:hypothetical protein
VHTTPPSLSLVDTRLDDQNPINRQLATAALCRNPNILAIDRPPAGERLALVSCYSDDQVAVVGLGAFQVIATLEVDDGPERDGHRRRAPPALRRHTLASTIDIVNLQRASPEFLKVTARIGLREPRSDRRSGVAAGEQAPHPLAELVAAEGVAARQREFLDRLVMAPADW